MHFYSVSQYPNDNIPMSENHLVNLLLEEKLYLNDEEIEFIQSIANDSKKLQYAYVRHFIRQSLQKKYRIAPENILINKQTCSILDANNLTSLRSGKPYIKIKKNDPNSSYNINLSMSHCQNKLAFFYSLKKEVGIDIEYIALNRPIHDISSRYFSPSEVNFINSDCHLNTQFYYFYALWCIKEALYKIDSSELPHHIYFEFNASDLASIIHKLFISQEVKALSKIKINYKNQSFILQLERYKPAYMLAAIEEYL